MDNNILELITKQLHGQITPAEAQVLRLWLEASPENRRFFADFSANLSMHESLTSPQLASETERMLSRLNARIDAAPAASRSRKWRAAATWVFGVAACICLLFGMVWFLRQPVGSPEKMEAFVNQTDEIFALVLDDGTHVFLLPGASIDYNVLTLRGKRVVNLTGDAYFDVSRDEDKPFFVRTSDLQVQVLGTAFSVSAGPDATQVVLERGAVRLLSPGGEPLVSMHPNQKAVLRKGGAGIQVDPVYASAFVTEKYNLVAFYDKTLSDILDALQEMFRVTLTCDQVPEGKHYNMAFLKSDSLEDVLAILEYMTGTECHIAHK